MTTRSDGRSSHNFEVTHTDEEWRKILSPEQYNVLRGHATERAGTCALLYEKRKGTFICAGCDQPLFVAKTKFESGTGWPSFNEPEPGSVETSPVLDVNKISVTLASDSSYNPDGVWSFGRFRSPQSPPKDLHFVEIDIENKATGMP